MLRPSGEGDHPEEENMAEHGFTLIVEGDVESRLDDLYEAGCDDATFHTTDGGAVWYAGFEREAPTREEAPRSAVADAESVGGLRARLDGWG